MHLATSELSELKCRVAGGTFNSTSQLHAAAQQVSTEYLFQLSSYYTYKNGVVSVCVYECLAEKTTELFGLILFKEMVIITE